MSEKPFHSLKKWKNMSNSWRIIHTSLNYNLKLDFEGTPTEKVFVFTLPSFSTTPFELTGYHLSVWLLYHGNVTYICSAHAHTAEEEASEVEFIHSGNQG